MTLRTRDLTWLAGLVEGEGCFRWSQARPVGPRRVLRVQLGMTDEDVVRRAAEVAGVGYVAFRDSTNPKHKPMWIWLVDRQSDAAALMMTLYPLMGARRQAKIREALLAWRAQTKQPTRAPAACGTRSGYARHLDRSEPPCPACKTVNAAYSRERRAVRSAA